MSNENESPHACTYDPLVSFMNHYAGATASRKGSAEQAASTSIEQRLMDRIVDGDRVGLEMDLRTALETHAPLEIINGILLEGMKIVGDLFGSGQMQLPFVLQSAETMKAAVSYLETRMEKSPDTTRGVMVLATVKGDVHDIGKNLVDIILTNNGFRVINLGIKVPVDTMINAAAENQADCIGMSGLLVKSTIVMKENLELMRERGMDIPVILGGAALTRRYVENDLRPLYAGALRYARDAFDGLHFMQDISNGLAANDRENADALETPRVGTETAGTRFQASAKQPLAGTETDSQVHIRSTKEGIGDSMHERRAIAERVPSVGRSSSVSRDVPVPSAPFLGSKVVTDIPVETMFEYMNENALVRGQWQFRRGSSTADEIEREMREIIRPQLDKLKLQLKRDKVLRPAVVYGFFPCSSDGNDVVIYKPRNIDAAKLHDVWPRSRYSRDELSEWRRFSFPRQSADRYLCIADYFHSVNDEHVDVCAFHLVTVGSYASEYTAKLFRDNKYQEYLYIHGLTVELAEALAEYWHRSIRHELGIAADDAAEIRKLFSQGYRGSRYSFGYPACPNLEHHEQLFDILKPERIGVTLTEEYQLVPEQSTSAIIVHHPQAKYFIIK